MKRFIFAPEAEADIDGILDHIAAENDDAAERLRHRFHETFRMLANFPASGHQRRDLAGDRPLLFWPTGRYLIVYRPIHVGIEVVAVLHGSRDIPAVLREREEGE